MEAIQALARGKQSPKENNMDPRRFPAGGSARDGSMYKELEATELYCPRCRQAGPVRKRLLLVLPEGDQYEYLCARCNESVGSKMDRDAEKTRLIY